MENYTIVSFNWLRNNLYRNDMVVIEAFLRKPQNQKGKIKNINDTKIEGSVKIDLNEVSDPDSSLPHTMITKDNFNKIVGSKGIKKDQTIIIYDEIGTYVSPRLWWMFKSAGYIKVAVLNGGLPAFNNGFTLRQIPAEKMLADKYQKLYQEDCTCYFCDREFIAGNINNSRYQIVDLRQAERFNGSIPEPREGLRRGNIPGSINIPFTLLQENGLMKNIDELTRIIENKISSDKKIIVLCGSGVTSCILALALYIIGKENIIVYDGSWAEWGQIK